MRLTLALRSLQRHRARTTLAVLGVAIAAAMLLDMVMLSGGLRESFADLLGRRGFQFRLAPKGTLPFDTEATIAGGRRIAALISANPDVDAVSPVLGTSVHALVGSGEGDAGAAEGAAADAVTSFALGVLPAVQGDYTLASGRDVSAPGELVANFDFLRATRREIGDTISLAAGYNPLLRAATRTRRFTIAGTANFLYLSAAQPAVAIMLPEMQRMAGEGVAASDRVSLLMVRAREGANLDSLEKWMAASAPAVEVISTRKALQTVDERLEYFKQIALILGAVSLAVGFLLVTTLMTVSVNERIGEIAVQRAIGITRGGVIAQIVLEGIAISVAGALLGLALGLVTARYLNSILSSFPGLPAAIDFFLFQPASAWRALGMLVAAGILAGIYPAWRAGSLGIARTLREEAVA